jgi:hypothetical protein
MTDARLPRDPPSDAAKPSPTVHGSQLDSDVPAPASRTSCQRSCWLRNLIKRSNGILNRNAATPGPASFAGNQTHRIHPITRPSRIPHWAPEDGATGRGGGGGSDASRQNKPSHQSLHKGLKRLWSTRSANLPKPGVREAL